MYLARHELESVFIISNNDNDDYNEGTDMSASSGPRSLRDWLQAVSCWVTDTAGPSDVSRAGSRGVPY